MKNPYKITDKIYSRKSNIGGLKENVSKNSDSPYYFDKGSVKFFGSKVENVYSTPKNDKFLFREKLTNSPDGKLKYKIGEYDYNKKTLKTSEIYDSKGARDYDFNRLQKGEVSINELNN